MATSTFKREFRVIPEKEDEFADEMTRKVTPTLEADFKSHFVCTKELKDALQRALE